MTLEEKIKKIDNPSVTDINSIGPLPSGSADTIKEFFDNFIKARLPKESVIREWHKLLMEYTDDISKVSCCVRFGNDGNNRPSAYGESGYYKLRRGWLTQNDCDDFEYFFADNFFSSFIYKMALDEYVPTINEFKDIFRQHKFPYGFGFMIDKRINEYKGAVIPTASEPGFLGHYKLSHVFDSGEHFCINGSERGDSWLTDEYFPIGHSDDFLKNSGCIRKMHIEDDAKKVIIAKFLRFAHPFNYFLTPAKTHHICKQHVYKNDIGEEPKMIDYVKQYLQNTYPAEYSEFLSKIMWYDNPKNAFIVTGKEKIDIVYGLSINKKATVKSIKALPAKKAVKNTIDLSLINQTYLESFKVGEIANQVLRAILNSGKISKTDVDKMKSEKGPKSTFELSIPVLSDTIKDSSGQNRYYSEPIVLYGETLYLCSQWLQKHKNNLIKWICNWISSNGDISVENTDLFAIYDSDCVTFSHEDKIIVWIEESKNSEKLISDIYRARDNSAPIRVFEGGNYLGEWEVEKECCEEIDQNGEKYHFFQLIPFLHISLIQYPNKMYSSWTVISKHVVSYQIEDKNIRLDFEENRMKCGSVNAVIPVDIYKKLKSLFRSYYNNLNTNSGSSHGVEQAVMKEVPFGGAAVTSYTYHIGTKQATYVSPLFIDEPKASSLLNKIIGDIENAI